MPTYDTGDAIFLCTFCEEYSIQEKQVQDRIRLLKHQFQQEISLDEIEIDTTGYCVRCKLEDAESEVYDTKELVEQLSDPYYFDHKKIRNLFFKKIPEFYSSKNDESMKLLRLIIHELFYKRPAKKTADKLLFEIFELRDHMFEFELKIIVDEFEKIIALVEKDPYKVDTGIPILFSCLLMNQVYAIEQYIDRLLDTLIDSNKINKTYQHIGLIISRYREKVPVILERMKSAGITKKKYEEVLDFLERSIS